MSERAICPYCGDEECGGETGAMCETAYALVGSYEPPKAWWVFSNGRAIYSEPTEEQARKLAGEWRSEMIRRGNPEPRMQLEHAVYPPAETYGHGWVPSSAAIAI